MKKMTNALTKCVLLCLMASMLFVLPASAAKASIRLSTSKITLKVGSSKRLKATVTGKKKKVTWKSSKSSVAKVSSTGLVTARKPGKTVITASANGKTARCTVTVKQADYKKLYKSLLEQSSIQAGNYSITPKYYYMLNIDKKGVPELVVTNCDSGFGGFAYYIFTVKNGKVVYSGECSEKGVATPVFKYSSKYKALCVGGWINGVGGVYTYLYGMSGTDFIVKQHATEYHYPEDEYYYGTKEKESKKVSKSKYKTFCNKYFSNLKKYTMKANTAANRNRSFGK